ncbi:MAG: hypothetical protein H7228_13465 [Polaromonas sp.]|nr:hypothetical protein [Polaromonas sp.]
MASARGFLGTSPSPIESARGEPGPEPATERTDLALAGVIGSRLSEPLAAMQYVVTEFIRTKKISSVQVQLLKSSLDLARTVAMQSQQISRLAEGRLRQSHERLKLDELLQTAIKEHGAAFQQRGVELYQKIQPVEVIVDPGLLSSLLDVALDWAISMGKRLVVSLEMKNWPEHGILLFKVSDSVASGVLSEGRPTGDSLEWYLLTEVARAMGVTVDRVVSSYEYSLLIEFPRTVKRLEGMTAVEVDTGGDSMASESKPLAGHRLLVISSDARLASDIRQVCRSLGLVVDFVPSTLQGVRFCELDVPHMIVIDERERDHIFDELRDDLRKTDPNFPFVEIANEANTLEVAGWMSDSMTRLSRDSLRSHLSSILVLELAKVM